MSAPRLTTNQKDVLGRVGRLSRSGDGWISARACGSPSTLEHLYEKGYLDRVTRRGPLGGTYYYYALTVLGRETADRLTVVAARKMLAGEIDARLIAARKAGEPVLVYCGSSAYVRGVPGPVERDDETGHVVLKIGVRKIPLLTISAVESGG